MPKESEQDIQRRREQQRNADATYLRTSGWRRRGEPKKLPQGNRLVQKKRGENKLVPYPGKKGLKKLMEDIKHRTP